jgi:predicted transposase YdaD
MIAKNEMIDVITTITAYKFANLSREEVESMLGITFEETRLYRELKAEGQRERREEGRQEATIALVMRLLHQQLSQELSSELRSQLSNLPLPVLEDLSEALLDFSTLADLQTWLEAQQ